MATKKINYKDKAPLQTKPEIPEENKVNAEDLNQIKEVVNNNADEIELRQLKEEGKGLSKNDFTDELKAKLESLNNYNDTEIKKEISEINKKVAENTENDIKQDNEIATLKTNYTNLQEQNTKLEEKIKKDRENMINLEVEGQSIHIEDSSNLEGQLEVLGNVEQETSIQGKNKLNLRQSNYTVSEINVIKNNSTLTLNGKMNIAENLLETVGDMYKFIYLGKFKAGTYRFSKFIISGKYSIDKNIGEGTFACYIRKKDKTFLGEIRGNAIDRTGVTITLQEDTDLYMQIFCNAGAIFENCVLGFQLEEGEKTTDFEQFIPNMPSPEYPSEIRAVGDKGSIGIKKQNKNLFDILKYPFTNKVAYAPNGQLNYWTGYYGITEYFPVEENSNYVFSNDLNKPITYGLMFYNKNKEFISGIVENTTKFITPKNCKYIRFSVQSDTIPNKVQIEYGDKATEIVEHQEQTKILPIQKPMLRIGNTRDIFIKKEGKWYERHFINKVIFNGTESWSYNKSGGNFAYRQIDNNTQYGKNNEILAISNYLKPSTFNNYNKADNIVFAWSTEPYICIKATNSIVDAGTTKTWVKKLYDSGNPLIIYRTLITPTDLLCTPEQIEILDELDNFQTYKPVTNITTDSIAKLKLKYIADTKTYIDNKTSNLEQQVNTINQLLSTTRTSAKLLDNLQSDIESEVL